MKQLLKYCNADEKIDIIKNKLKIKALQSELQVYGIEIKVKNDLNYFYLEAMHQSLLNKQAFELVFIKTHYEMNDYWDTLNYQEKKLLMNVEINKLLPTLKFVGNVDKPRYIPFFDEHFNQIYLNEMTLFELKQYGLLMRQFKEHCILKDINYECIYYGFTSLKFIKGNEEAYWAYCKDNHRFYFMNQSTLKYSIGLKWFDEEDREGTHEFIDLMMSEDEIAIMQFLCNKSWISDSLKHKFDKIIKKTLSKR